MAELEIHQESAENDPAGKRVGAFAAVIAVFLAAVTILAHRAHTDAVIFKTEANDQWAFYQAKSLKGHSAGLGLDLLTAIGGNSEASRTMLTRYAEEQKRYEKEAVEVQTQAKERDQESTRAEQEALRFDLGEGLLEIGLVLSSLFFIARRKIFPLAGTVAAACGIAIALSVLMLP